MLGCSDNLIDLPVNIMVVEAEVEGVLLHEALLAPGFLDQRLLLV